MSLNERNGEGASARAPNLAGAKAAVVGLGIEGIDLTRFLAARGARVTVSDARPAPELAGALARAMERLRRLDLFKPPGVAETLDWASALQVLGAEVLSPEAAGDTLGVILKYEDDIERVRAGGVGRLTAAD